MTVFLAALTAKLRDFLRNRRNKQRTMSQFPNPPSPSSESETEHEYQCAGWLGQDEEPIEEPLVERLTREDYNSQISSPLFNGRIPPEIRNRIFEYVLTEDEDIQYNQNTHYTRPGYGFHKSLLTNLLQTCRRVYLEAHHLPLINREHVFWHHREPEGSGYENEAAYFARFRPDQLALVRKVHLFTQQFWLEGSLRGVCKLPVMQTLEKMTITLRRGDWWFWENGNTLGINPQRGDANSYLMRTDWRWEATGHIVPWDESAWGCSFKHLKKLQELEMEFETTVYEEKQLQEIAEHAKTWKFPMGEGKVLSAAGQKVHRSTWQGPKCVWSNRCEGCRQYGDRNSDCKVCRERKESKEKGMGPNLVVLRLWWKLAAADAHGC